MSTIVGICGSRRSGSFNMMLLRAVAAAVPHGTTIETASIRDVPLYDGDFEASAGIPPPVQLLKDAIAKSSRIPLRWHADDPIKRGMHYFRSAGSNSSIGLPSGSSI
jgi:hypothetical protein